MKDISYPLFFSRRSSSNSHKRRRERGTTYMYKQVWHEFHSDLSLPKMTSHVCVAITFHGQWITFRAVRRVQASDFVPRALAMMNGRRRSGVSTWAVIGSQHALCNAGTTWPPEKTDGKVLRENLLVELPESLILQLQRMLMTQQWRRLVVH